MPAFYRITAPLLLIAGLAAVTQAAPVTGEAAAADSAAAIVDNLSAFRFDKLGHPQIESDSIQPARATADRPHRLLILPVRFPDKEYDRFQGEPDQDARNRHYFQDLLFAGGAENPEAGTLSHYYRHQSRGLYNITGDIFPVVELQQPMHYYGRPIQGSDGNWRSDERATELVTDTLRAAYRAQPDFPWQDYDLWDPTDFDGDGNRDEPDGYLDHFIMIVAGKGQASCQGLYKLSEKLTVNSSADAFFELNADEQACADRLWPHRFSLSQNLGKGPEVDGKVNARGGVDIGNGLWVLDYNMQSEYTEVSTFIHEFGHSLGLPDVYARQTNNSTASWEAMSATASPQPQELSAWSRTVLGWMQPCVVRPPEFGGSRGNRLYLKAMSDWSGDPENPAVGDACDAAMVILPPKFRDIELGPLNQANGRQAAYSGQGNNMLRSLSRQFDLSAAAPGEPLVLQLDTWFEIEAEWDYLYLEAAGEDGEFRRLLPMDKSAVDDRNSVMPAAKGHEGAGSLPGFTGLSGDRDGDGKVETATGCDPTAERTMAEDKVGTDEQDPCEAAQWVTARFDLGDYRDQSVTVRLTYFTDGAAVENGALVDNISLAALGFTEDFEDGNLDGWESVGFTLSGGSHHLPVPHFYLLEYRDPYAQFERVKNYDRALSHPGFMFYPHAEAGMEAANANYRPGVLMWYYNGEYLWSQNEPAETGPGNGYLLLVDSTPQEFDIPAMPAEFFRRDGGWTRWELDDSAQPLLRQRFVDTMCFQRRPAYYSADVSAEERARCERELNAGRPPMEALRWDNRRLTYGYTIVNELLPGPERRALKGATTMFDLRLRKGEAQFRLYDRILRNWHSADAPFAVSDFADGLEFYRSVDGELRRSAVTPFRAVSEFSDADPGRYQNPHLPFGSAAIPKVGFSYKLRAPDRRAPAESRVRIDYRFR